MRTILLALAVVIGVGRHVRPVATAPARLPQDDEVLPASTSPDGKHAVLGVDLDALPAGTDPDAYPCQILEVATGKVLGAIAAPSFYRREGHATASYRWSKDGSLLLWFVQGKWGSLAVAVVKVAHGAIVEQIDVRAQAVRHTLAALKRARPKMYAIAKHEGEDDGSWFRDGFAIDVKPDRAALNEAVYEPWLEDPIPPPSREATAAVALPMTFVIEVTSNTKQRNDYPVAGDLRARGTVTVDATGKLEFSQLRVWRPKRPYADP